MVLERKTKSFLESKLILNEDGGDQVENNLRTLLFLKLNDFRSDTEWLSQSACSVIFFPTVVNKGILCLQRMPDPAGALYQDLVLQRWATLCKLITKAKCNDPFCSWSVSLIQTMHSHSTSQAGELGSKSNRAFKVKGINPNGPKTDAGRFIGRSVHSWSNNKNHHQQFL